jgi:hypothetical protein
MYSEARKIHLIEEVLKVKSEAVLSELEAVLNRLKQARVPKLSAHDFVGILSQKDADLMDGAIKDSCHC